MNNAELADNAIARIAKFRELGGGKNGFITLTAQEYDAIIAALRQSSDKVLVRRDVIEFLRGAAPLDGLWFGEGRGYWWRTYLYKAEGHHE